MRPSGREKTMLYAGTLRREMSEGRLDVEGVYIDRDGETIIVIAFDPTAARAAVESIFPRNLHHSPMIGYARIFDAAPSPDENPAALLARLTEAEEALNHVGEHLAIRFTEAWGLVFWRGDEWTGERYTASCKIYPRGADDRFAAQLMEIATPHFQRVDGFINGQWIAGDPEDTAEGILAFQSDESEDPLTADFPNALARACAAASALALAWAAQGYPHQGLTPGITFPDPDSDRVRFDVPGAIITVDPKPLEGTKET
jgi:hypothetical protein